MQSSDDIQNEINNFAIWAKNALKETILVGLSGENGAWSGRDRNNFVSKLVKTNSKILFFSDFNKDGLAKFYYLNVMQSVAPFYWHNSEIRPDILTSILKESLQNTNFSKLIESALEEDHKRHLEKITREHPDINDSLNDMRALRKISYNVRTKEQDAKITEIYDSVVKKSGNSEWIIADGVLPRLVQEKMIEVHSDAQEAATILRQSFQNEIMISQDDQSFEVGGAKKLVAKKLVAKTLKP